MEGGGILNVGSHDKGDHLATRKCVKEKKTKASICLLVSGFNGFGQLELSKTKRMITQFQECEIPLPESKLPLVMACSWSQLAVGRECTLCLQGFINKEPGSIKYSKTESCIKALALCDQYCLILTENGKLYRLSNHTSASMEEIKFQVKRKAMVGQKRTNFGEHKMDANMELRIDYISCGNNIMVAVGNSNEVFNDTMQLYQFPKHERTRQLVCGFEHALLLTNNGDVYSWGNGLRGQLGRTVLKVEETPIIVEALVGIKICCISSSGWHSAAISVFGDLYTWGYNSNGQLGLRLFKNSTYTVKEPTVYPLPQFIDLPVCCCTSKSNDDCLPLKVVCGARHTILLMSCGTIFACGYNAHGQLGSIDAPDSCDTLKRVFKIESNASNIVCGAWSTLIDIQ